MTALMIMMTIQAIPPPPVIYTPPRKCEWMDEGDWDACVAPESWHDFCWSVTSYTVYDENGNIMYGTLNSDADPTGTAVGVRITSPAQHNSWVALPLPLINDGFYSFACLGELECLPGWDTFGAPSYQAGGFWHPIWQEKVIGVDIFTDDIVHYVTCDGELEIYYDGELTDEDEHEDVSVSKKHSTADPEHVSDATWIATTI